MAFGEVLKAHYVGRSAALQDSLQLLQSARAKDSAYLQESMYTLRRNLAKRLRSSKLRLRNLERKRAAGEAQAALASNLLSLERAYHEHAQNYGKESLSLALRIASEVLAAQPQELSRTLAKRVSRELSRLRINQPLRLEVHPSDEEALKLAMPDSPALSGLPLSVNESVPPGEAAILTPVGSVSISWRAHLRHLETQILKALAQKQAHSKPR